jgi:GxxExxY protein
MELQNHLSHKVPLEQLTGEVIGAAIEVHRALGPGYLEQVYEEALTVEMTLQKIPFVRQYPIGLSYKGHVVGEGRLDFLVSDILVVELKAVEEILPVHKAQVISYLKTTEIHLGLLINFNVTVLKSGIRRIILD